MFLTVSAAIQKAMTLLPAIEAEILLADVLKINRTLLHAYPERELTPVEIHQFDVLQRRRLQGEPVAYLTGQREFWSLSLDVSCATLVPRPETENLVEWILQKHSVTEVYQVADLGTGCGAIALALARERPHWQVWAVDNSDAALEVAKRNAQRLGLLDINFLKSDWCAALPKLHFNLIVSNPPYLAEHDPHLKDLQFEPQTALVSGRDGLTDLKQIIQQAPDYLLSGGWLVLEHGYAQGEEVVSLLQKAGFSDCACHLDLSGLPRMSVGCWQGGRRLC